MKKNEIDEFIEARFKNIERYFHKAIVNFETEHILKFRAEIKKLKIFLHLINMESEDGLSCRITKRMKTLYGYFGIIYNLQMQLKKIKEYMQKSVHNEPACYVNKLEKELKYWEKLSHDFIDASYNFINDKQEIMAILPDKLAKRSIKKFIHYTLYELNTMAGRTDDEALDNVRKSMEDIYYNHEFITPFIDEQQSNLFNKTAVEECMKLLDGFRDKCVALALLETFCTSGPDEHEKQLLKELENEWLNEKKDLKTRLIAVLDSMNIKANNLKEFAVADIADE